jgi:hypothetical protein
MTVAPVTTYERATRAYDDAHERELADAIMTAIAEASKVSDANALVLRTGEAASALVTVLAAVLALSPTAARSPTAIRKTVDELGKRLRRLLAAAENDQCVQAFARRCFRSDDVGGRA